MKKKDLNLQNSKKLEIKFNKFLEEQKLLDDSLLKPEECSLIYNYSTFDGTLTNSYGVSVLNVDIDGTATDVEVDGITQIKGVWSDSIRLSGNNAPDDYMFYMDQNNKLYYIAFDLGVDLPINIGTFTDIPSVTKIKQGTNEAFVFASASDDVILLNQSSKTTYSNVPRIVDAIYHYDQLFAISADLQSSLIYSDDIVLTNWTNSNVSKINFVDDNGQLLKLVNFNDNLYVFREFGITKINAYSINSDFAISHIYKSPTYILPKTICVCGENVIFMSGEGVFCFDGNSVSKLNIPVFERIYKQLDSSAVATVYNGKYYIACKFAFDDDVEIGCESGTFKNNAVLIVDIEKETVEIVRGIDILMFAPIVSGFYDKLCAIFNGTHKNKFAQIDNSGNVFGTALKKCWKSAFSDFGYPDNKKRIDNISILVKQDCQIEVCDELTTKIYQVSSSENVQNIKINQTANRFSVSIITNQTTQQKISNIKVNLTVF